MSSFAHFKRRVTAGFPSVTYLTCINNTADLQIDGKRALCLWMCSTVTLKNRVPPSNPHPQPHIPVLPVEISCSQSVTQHQPPQNTKELHTLKVPKISNSMSEQEDEKINCSFEPFLDLIHSLGGCFVFLCFWVFISFLRFGVMFMHVLVYTRGKSSLDFCILDACVSTVGFKACGCSPVEG